MAGQCGELLLAAPSRTRAKRVGWGSVDIAHILVSMRAMPSFRRSSRRAAHSVSALTLSLVGACSQDWSEAKDGGSQDTLTDATMQGAPSDGGMDSSAVTSVNGISLSIIDGSVYALVDGKLVPAVIDGVSLSVVDGSVVGVSDGAVVTAVVDGAVVAVIDGAVSTPGERDAGEAAPVTCGTGQCQHGGTCTVISNVTTCSCAPFVTGGAPAWSGASCENDVNECQGAHMCPTGFGCDNMLNGYTCAGEMADFMVPRTNTARAVSDFLIDSASNTALDTVSGLRWERAHSSTRVTFADAQQTCSELRTLGHADWRLPSYFELMTLVSGTSIRDQTLSNVFTFGDVWTRTPMPGKDVPAFLWDWHSELTDTSESAPTNAHVRCVRREGPSCSVPPHLRFKTQQGMVFDQCTKLTWEQLPAGNLYLDATNAGARCNTLTLGSKKWRVPTYLELLTTLDRARATDLLRIATAASYITNANSCFMSSTPISQLNGDGSRPPAAMLANGDVWRLGPPTEGCVVRCVSE